MILLHQCVGIFISLLFICLLTAPAFFTLVSIILYVSNQKFTSQSSSFARPRVLSTDKSGMWLREKSRYRSKNVNSVDNACCQQSFLKFFHRNINNFQENPTNLCSEFSEKKLPFLSLSYLLFRDHAYSVKL